MEQVVVFLDILKGYPSEAMYLPVFCFHWAKLDAQQ